jgi:hypothetical protein
MTGPAKHYPQVRARDRIRAICGACDAQDADGCLYSRKRGDCPLDGAFDALEAKLRPRETAPTQKRLNYDPNWGGDGKPLTTGETPEYQLKTKAEGI